MPQRQKVWKSELHFRIRFTALTLLTSVIPPWGLSITPQMPQLPFFFCTVKVLTDHESCRYEGPLIRVWLAHESLHPCVCSELCVMAGLYNSARRTDGGPNSLTHSGSQRPRCEHCFGSSHHMLLVQTYECDTN